MENIIVAKMNMSKANHMEWTLVGAKMEKAFQFHAKENPGKVYILMKHSWVHQMLHIQ